MQSRRKIEKFCKENKVELSLLRYVQQGKWTFNTPSYERKWHARIQGQTRILSAPTPEELIPIIYAEWKRFKKDNP